MTVVFIKVPTGYNISFIPLEKYTAILHCWIDNDLMASIFKADLTEKEIEFIKANHKRIHFFIDLQDVQIYSLDYKLGTMIDSEVDAFVTDLKRKNIDASSRNNRRVGSNEKRAKLKNHLNERKIIVSKNGRVESQRLLLLLLLRLLS